MSFEEIQEYGAALLNDGLEDPIWPTLFNTENPDIDTAQIDVWKIITGSNFILFSDIPASLDPKTLKKTNFDDVMNQLETIPEIKGYLEVIKDNLDRNVGGEKIDVYLGASKNLSEKTELNSSGNLFRRDFIVDYADSSGSAFMVNKEDPLFEKYIPADISMYEGTPSGGSEETLYYFYPPSVQRLLVHELVMHGLQASDPDVYGLIPREDLEKEAVEKTNEIMAKYYGEPPRDLDYFGKNNMITLPEPMESPLIYDQVNNLEVEEGAGKQRNR